MINLAQNNKIHLIQKVIATESDGIAVVEFETKSMRVVHSYEIQRLQSGDIQIAIYKRDSDPDILRSELDALIEKILSNPKQDELNKRAIIYCSYLNVYRLSARKNPNEEIEKEFDNQVDLDEEDVFLLLPLKDSLVEIIEANEDIPILEENSNPRLRSNARALADHIPITNSKFP